VKVLAIVQTWNRDDPIRGFIVRWMETLADRTDQLTILTLEQRHEATHSKIKVYSLGKEHTEGIGKRIQYLGRWHRCMKQIMRDDRPQVVFTHMTPIYSVLAAPYAKARGIPIVTWYAHPSLTCTLRLAHLVSTRTVASIATAYPYKHNKLTVIGQGIDVDLFSPEFGVSPEQPPIILCVGRLSPVKDHPTLLKAAWLLRQNDCHCFRVVIIGGPATSHDEKYVLELHRQVKQLGLEATVHFEPTVSMERLPLWYRRCAVYVNMTPTGSGDKVVWEAMACGKPAVVANEGFKETLGEYADRLAFRYGTPEELALRLKSLLSVSTEDRARIGDYLRMQVINMHSLPRLVSNLLEVMGSLKVLRVEGLESHGI
jgi:glycosyltransferase involved in cell wall biosynthesis